MSENTEVEGTTKKRGSFWLLGPPVVLLVCATSLTAIVFTDLIVYHTCLVSLKINATECIMLRTNASSPEAKALEAKVEPYASMILMTKSLIESLLPGILSVFLGSWSDRVGRRPLLLGGLAGYTLTYFTLSLIANAKISPWYLLLAWIPRNIVGGICTVRLASTCYISDTTTSKYRTRQLALLEMSFSVGDMVGTLIGPLIYVHLGYGNVFRTAMICCASALIYVYFRVPESLECTSGKSIRGLLRLSIIKDLMTSTSVKRHGFRRSVVWLGISMLTLNMLILRAHKTVAFLFTRVRLGWNVQRHSYYTISQAASRVAGLYGASLLGPVLGLSDTLLAGLGIASILGDSITKSLAWKSWHMYLSICIEVFSGIVGPAIRSIVSKSVPVQDVGKVLALTAFLEALISLAGVPLYTLIYSNYLPPIYPSPVYLLTTIFCVLLIILLAFISVLLKKSCKPSAYAPASQEDKI